VEKSGYAPEFLLPMTFHILAIICNMISSWEDVGKKFVGKKCVIPFPEPSLEFQKFEERRAAGGVH